MAVQNGTTCGEAGIGTATTTVTLERLHSGGRTTALLLRVGPVIAIVSTTEWMSAQYLTVCSARAAVKSANRLPHQLECSPLALPLPLCSSLASLSPSPHPPPLLLHRASCIVAMADDAYDVDETAFHKTLASDIDDTTSLALLNEVYETNEMWHGETMTAATASDSNSC